jgi:F0F1-type ATP synthase assembly protein I
MKNNLGMLLLGIWLIASGVVSLLGITIPFGFIILSILAIAAGVLIILKR